MDDSLSTHCRKGTGSLEGNREQGAGNRDLGGLPAIAHQDTRSRVSPCGYVDNDPLALSEALNSALSRLANPRPESETRHPVIRDGRERTILAPPVRLAVLLRDTFRCARCGFNVRREAAEIDHITPWSAGGADITSNLRTMCAPCNQERSNFVDPGEAPRLPATFWCDTCVGRAEVSAGRWYFEPNLGHTCWFCRQDWWTAVWTAPGHRPAESPFAAIATPIAIPARCLHCATQVETQWAL